MDKSLRDEHRPFVLDRLAGLERDNALVDLLLTVAVTVHATGGGSFVELGHKGRAVVLHCSLDERHRPNPPTLPTDGLMVGSLKLR